MEAADGYLTANGIFVDDQNRRTMARALGAAMQRASLTLAKLARGEVILDFPISHLAVAASSASSRQSQRSVSFQDLLDGWAAERRPVAKTVYEWSRVIRELEKYLGHRDVHRLTPENLVEWKRMKACLRSRSTVTEAILSLAGYGRFLP